MSSQGHSVWCSYKLRNKVVHKLLTRKLYGSHQIYLLPVHPTSSLPVTRSQELYLFCEIPHCRSEGTW